MTNAHPVNGEWNGEAPAQGMRRYLPWLVYSLAAAALAWVFHDVSLSELLGQLRQMSLLWLVPAVACDILSYVCQGARWHYLLRPAGRLSALKATQAIYVGLFANEVVPMRLGEFAAAFLAGRWIGLPIRRVLPSMLVGRLLDGIWLAAAVGLLLVSVPLPAEFEWAGDSLGVAVCLGVGVFVMLLRQGTKHRGRTEARASSSKLRRQFSELLTDIAEIREPAWLGAAAAYSFGVLAFQALAFWFVMRAYHLSVGVLAGFAVFLIVHFGTAIPNAPANIGSFQFFTVMGLTLFGVEKPIAAGFSAVVFLVLTIPLWVIGFVVLSRTGLSLRGIRGQIAERD